MIATNPPLTVETAVIEGLLDIWSMRPSSDSSAGKAWEDGVRLSETFIDEGGFQMAQEKTGREVWCPIDDALAAEMATWERRPGPYLYHSRGSYSRKVLDVHFAEQRDQT